MHAVPRNGGFAQDAHAKTIYRKRISDVISDVMKTLFDEDTWLVHQAIWLFCGGPSETDTDVRAWLRDTNKSYPSGDKVVRVRAGKVVQKLRQQWGGNINDLKMPPILWVWFAASKLRGSTAPSFREAFEIWATKMTLAGTLPIAQRRSDKTDTWLGVDLSGNPYTVFRGVPATTLIQRPFKKEIDPARWRLVRHPLAPSRDVKPRWPIRTPQMSSRSNGCEKRIREALDVLCKRNLGIERLRRPSKDRPPYKSNDLRQMALIKLLRSMPQFAGKSYMDNTMKRSLSFTISCKPGPPEL